MLIAGVPNGDDRKGEVRDHLLLMPPVGTEEKCLFGGIFLLPNLVDYKNQSYPTNIELLAYATQLLKDKNKFTQPEGCLKNHLANLFLLGPNPRPK